MTDEPPSRTEASIRFQRIGSTDHLEIISGEDLVQILELDLNHWVALAFPVEGVHAERKLLQHLAADDDKHRVQARDIRSATRWSLSVITNPSVFDDARPQIDLAAFSTSDEGKRMRTTAERVLTNLGESRRTVITLEDLARSHEIFADAGNNGDGVIPPDTISSEALRKVAEEIASTQRTTLDRSGKPGIDQAAINTFFAELEAYVTWWRKGVDLDTASGKERYNKDVLIFGSETELAYPAFRRVESAVDAFFQQCQARAFAPEAVTETFTSIPETAHGAAISEHLRNLPPARINLTARLPLRNNVNPAYADDLRALNREVVRRVVGHELDELDSESWARIKEALSPYIVWLASKEGTSVESLGVRRCEQILAGKFRNQLEALIAHDLALANQLAGIGDLEKLLLYKRDLIALANNCVAMPHFYRRAPASIVEAGRLYMDGRRFGLCLHVNDRATHLALAAKSGIYLLYCDLARLGEPRRTIAVAVTAGGCARLVPGRSGLFYDRQNRVWDATVSAIVPNAISLLHSTVAPFVRIGQAIAEQVERISQVREKSLSSKVALSAEEMDSTLKESLDRGKVSVPAEDPAMRDGGTRGGLGGLLAGGGLAIAALSSSFAYLTAELVNVPLANVVYTTGAIILLLILPSMVAALLKLRARDLGLLLEASGWAVNGHLRIDRALGRALTERAPLPPGATVDGVAGVVRLRTSKRRRRLVLCLVLALVMLAFILQLY